MKAVPTEYVRFVTLMISARILETGAYEITFRGAVRAGKSEVAGYYYFIASPDPTAGDSLNFYQTFPSELPVINESGK